jgi:hypothetical protein
MDDTGSDFCKRLQDEETFVHPRMGNDQVGFAADDIAVEEQIEVESARSILDSPYPAETDFDFEQETQQVGGSEIGANLRGGVEIGALTGGTADRRCLVECGDLRDRDALTKGGQPAVEMVAAVAEVAAESDVGGDGHGGTLSDAACGLARAAAKP